MKLGADGKMLDLHIKRVYVAILEYENAMAQLKLVDGDETSSQFYDANRQMGATCGMIIDTAAEITAILSKRGLIKVN